MDTSFRLHPEQGSVYASHVDQLYLFLLLVSAVMTIAIAAAIVYFSIKYRRGSTASRKGASHNNLRMELLWIAGPLTVMLAIFFWGTQLFFAASVPPSGAMQIQVVGKQWMWKFQHPTGRIEVNELHVPVDQAIELNMISEDVIHSMFLPVFRIKQDVLPGRITKTWFQANETGIFHLFCAEYCGTDHSRMRGRIHVMTPNDYQNWLAGGVSALPPEKAGEELFESLGCHTCHRQTGPEPMRGPPLVGLIGRQVRLQTGETVVADENYIRESIVRPAAKIVAGYPAQMPTFENRLSEEQMLQLVAYIKSLSKNNLGSTTPEPANNTEKPAR